MIKTTRSFQLGLVILLAALILAASGLYPLYAAPEATGFNSWVHINCSTCATATPVLLVNEGVAANSGLIAEFQAQSTPVARMGQGGVWGSLTGSTLTVSGSTITPTSNVVPLSSTAVQTVSGIITSNFHTGAKLLLYNTVTTNTVISETASLQLSAGTITLGQYDTLELIWDATRNAWLQVGRSDN